MQITLEHLRRMEVPKLHYHVSLTNIPDTCPQKEQILHYLKNIKNYLSEGFGLLFFGDYSTGKSAAACMILKAGAILGKSGLFMMCSAIPDLVYNNRLFDENESYYNRLKSVDILVIDELLFFKDQRDFLIEQLIRERRNALKTTIITTNLSKNDIKSVYPALYQVLIETVMPVKFAGHNFREDRRKEIAEAFNDS